MNETKYLCIWRIMKNGFQARLIIMHVLLQFTAFHVKNIYKNLDVLKYVISLTVEVVFHECFLAASERQCS
jgi:hypothetical protein